MTGTFNGQFPPPNQPIVQADGRPTIAMANVLAALKTFLLPDLNPQPILQTDFISGIIAIPANTAYRVVELLPYDATITKFTTKLVSGTITAALSSNGVAVTGGSINATNAQASTVPSANNVAAAGNDITITGSAAASPSMLSFTIEFTRVIG